MAPSETDTRALVDLISSTLGVLHQFNLSLAPSANTRKANTATSTENPPNPLRVLSDSAKLLKAHTTKLSLLAINKPFTPSAITKVLKEFAGTCLPAMMSAVQICEQEQDRWSGTLVREVKLRVLRVFKEIPTLLGEIKAIAEGNGGGAGRDSLSSTGIVWESCDALIELEQLGIGGLAVQKAEQYRATIKDAIEELHDWAEGEALETEGRADGLLDSDDEGVDGDRDSVEDIFHASNSLPKDREDLKELAEEAEVRLKKVVILFAALVKRRLRTFQSDVSSYKDEHNAPRRLDHLLFHLKRIPYRTDELAGALYDLDRESADTQLELCITEAMSACEAMSLDWKGHTDEFTEWSRKWIAATHRTSSDRPDGQPTCGSPCSAFCSNDTNTVETRLPL